jgi:hypothetical protein
MAILRKLIASIYGADAYSKDAAYDLDDQCVDIMQVHAAAGSPPGKTQVRKLPSALFNFIHVLDSHLFSRYLLELARTIHHDMHPDRAHWSTSWSGVRSVESACTWHHWP